MCLCDLPESDIFILRSRDVLNKVQILQSQDHYLKHLNIINHKEIIVTFD